MNTRAVYFLTLINIFNYLDRYLINAVLPLIAAQFALTHTQQGTVVAAFTIGYVFFSPLFGYFGDRKRRPLLMTIGVLCWAVATISTSLAAGFLSLLLARIFVGVGEASYGTIVPGYLKDFVKDPLKLNKYLSIFFAAIPVGSALGFLLGGKIAALSSWRMVFLAGSLPTFLLAPFLLRFPECEREAPPPFSVKENLKTIIERKVLLLAVGGYVLNTFALTGIAAFIVTYGVELGFNLTTMTNYFSGILVVTGFLGTLLGGRLAARFAKKDKTQIGGMLKFVSLTALIAVPFLGLVWCMHSPLIFFSLAAVAELLIFAGLAPINTIIVLASPPGLVTFVQGLTIVSINLLGSLLGPILIGWVADRTHLSIGLQLSTLSLLFCGLVWGAGRTIVNNDPGSLGDSPGTI